MIVVKRRTSASVTWGDERRYGVEESARHFSTRSRDLKSVVTLLMYASSVLRLLTPASSSCNYANSRSETRLVYAVVDIVVDPLVHLLDILLQVLGEQIHLPVLIRN